MEATALSVPATGNLICIGFPILAWFFKVFQQMFGDRQQGVSSGFGYDKAFLVFSNITRLAYIELSGLSITLRLAAFLSCQVLFNSQCGESRRLIRNKGHISPKCVL